MGPLDDDRKPPRPGRGLLWRATIGALLIFACSAATVASAGLLEVDQLIRIVKSESAPIPGIEGALDNVPAGKPQTILVLGSDRRFQDIKEHNPVRSDTILLVRLDPSRGVTAVMSIPRDLKVDIPTPRGFVTDKINAAYALGGPSLSVRTVKNLLHIPISHVVNVNFGGFRAAVNRLGCVYVDVDRDYFNDNHPPNGSPFDNDLVRAARQQSFLSAAKEQIGLGRIFGDRKELLRIFGRYTQTDIARQNTRAILRLLKLAFEASKNPIREGRASSGPRETAPAGRSSRATRRKTRKRSAGLPRGVIFSRVEAENFVAAAATHLSFPMYYPRARYSP